MYFKKPDLHHYMLVAVTKAHVIQKLPNGDFEVGLELADGVRLERIYKPVDYDELMSDPPKVIV